MKNQDPHYLGVEQINAEHHAQLSKFREWAVAGSWSEFHTNHYDWWMFPIDQPSQMGFRYVVFDEDVAELNDTPGFRERHAEGAQLLLRSWGWDLETNQMVESPAKDQMWQNWPIRLFKCTESMRLFGQTQMYESCIAFAKSLKFVGVSFMYNGRDLAKEMHI
jgi:hypothetical protein